MAKQGINKRFLILCKGVTEYIYAKSLQMDLSRDLQRYLTIDIIHGKYHDPKSLAQIARAKVREAKRERNAYDQVWLFFDNEECSQLDEAFNIIKQDGFKIAYTSKCFEHWLILHFENLESPFHNNEDALRYLQQLWPQYHKARSNPYRELKDRVDEAMRRAEVLGRGVNECKPFYQRNPYFTIGNLIKFFKSIHEGY